MAEKLYLNVEEVASRFGINPTTVYRLAQKRILPGLKVGGQWRFSQVALEDWAAHDLGGECSQGGALEAVSHELRTPLAILRESISQIADEVYGPTTQEQKGVLAISLKSIDRLSQIVGDLLDLSGVQQVHRKAH